MHIEIIEMFENSDGSATLNLDIDEDGKKFLIEAGFNSVMLKALEQKRTDDLVRALEEFDPRSCPDMEGEK